MKASTDQKECGCAGMACARNRQPTNSNHFAESVTAKTGTAAATTRTVEGHNSRTNESKPISAEPASDAVGGG